MLDYPVFYDLSASGCVGLSSTSRTKIDEGINLADDIIKTAATGHGFGFADVRTQFTGHQLCAGGTKWLHALNYFDITESYHPTADGAGRRLLPGLQLSRGITRTVGVKGVCAAAAAQTPLMARS